VLSVSEARGVAIRYNSFREFITERTTHLKLQVNSALARWYARHPDRDEAWRHRFRHLFQIGEYSTILATCDDEWLSRSWVNHRPVHEIQRNLDVVWRAAAQMMDVVEYVRVALLKQRVALVARNLDLSESEIAEFLVDMGRVDEGLRSIWDREHARCNRIEFERFVVKQAERIGRVRPRRILEAGLGSIPKEASLEETTTWYKARSYCAEPVELVVSINHFRWTGKTPYRYVKSQPTEDENRNLNLLLQLAVIQQLTEGKDIDGLRALSSSDLVPPIVRICAKAALALVLGSVGESGEAEALLIGLDLSALPARMRTWLVLRLTASGLPTIGKSLRIEPPDLPTQLLDRNQSTLNEAFFSLCDRLREFFLCDDAGPAWLEARSTGLGEPVASVVRALGRIAVGWCDSDKTKRKFYLSEVREIAVALDLNRRLFDGLGSYAQVGEYSYREAANRFFESLWSWAKDCLSAAISSSSPAIACGR